MAYNRLPQTVLAGTALVQNPPPTAITPAGIVPVTIDAEIATTTGLGVVQVGSGLAITPMGVLSTTGSGGASEFGFFTSTATQTNPVVNTANPVTFNATGSANGVSLVGNSQITVTNAGTYTAFFTVEVQKSSGPTSTVSFWFRLNGVNVPGSLQAVNVTNTVNIIFVSGNFTLNIPALGNVELYWSSPDSIVQLTALPAAITPTRPTGFSAKITVNRIS